MAIQKLCTVTLQYLLVLLKLCDHTSRGFISYASVAKGQKLKSQILPNWDALEKQEKLAAEFFSKKGGQKGQPCIQTSDGVRCAHFTIVVSQ
jgi:hypothetical protein